MNYFSNLLLVFSVYFLFGCASQLIDVRPGSERVSVASISQVSGCTSKGKTTVSVLSEVGFITRSVDAVEANLLQLARNGAVDVGADTLTLGDEPVFGRRTFGLYQCRP